MEPDKASDDPFTPTFLDRGHGVLEFSPEIDVESDDPFAPTFLFGVLEIAPEADWDLM